MKLVRSVTTVTALAIGWSTAASAEPPETDPKVQVEAAAEQASEEASEQAEEAAAAEARAAQEQAERAQTADFEEQRAEEQVAEEQVAAAATEACPEDDVEYAEEDTFEIGGSIGGLWHTDSFELSVRPTLGYFILDKVELSLFLDIEYTNAEDEETGERESSGAGALIIEPSYHLPIAEDLFLFGGLGLGVGYDFEVEDFDFEVIPRTGINVAAGLSGELTIAARVPIIVAPDETTVGIGFEAGYTVLF